MVYKYIYEYVHNKHLYTFNVLPILNIYKTENFFYFSLIIMRATKDSQAKEKKT